MMYFAYILYQDVMEREWYLVFIYKCNIYITLNVIVILYRHLLASKNDIAQYFKMDCEATLQTDSLDLTLA